MIDDLMASRYADGRGVFLVVNASRKEIDFAHIAGRLPSAVEIIPEPGLALLALQGPKAASVLSGMIPGVDNARLHDEAALSASASALSAFPVRATRARMVSRFPSRRKTRKRLRDKSSPSPMSCQSGLARAIRCGSKPASAFYGQDMDETTSPIEAGLAFSIGKRRRAEGGFPGAGRVQRELGEGPSHVRVGLRLEGRAAARTHMRIADGAGASIGEITSGAFTPSAAASIAMGYVPAPLADAWHARCDRNTRRGGSGARRSHALRSTPLLSSRIKQKVGSHGAH